MCAGEDGPVESRAQEGQPAPSDPAAPNLVSTSTAAQAGGVDTDAVETEDTEPATSSQAPAVAALIRPFVTRDFETTEQEGPESKRQRTVAGLPVCSLSPPDDENPVSYVATDEIDERPVYDHKTEERLAPYLVKVGRRTECEAMTRHQLFERVPIALGRGKKVRCQWLDEMTEGADGPFVRSRLVAMEVAHGIRFDTFAGTAPLKWPRQSRTREDDTPVCSPSTTSALRFGTHSNHTMSQLRCIRRVVKRNRGTCGK